MPELIRLFGMRFFFYANDHLPKHVHVRNADGEARYNLDTLSLIENSGIKPKDLKFSEMVIEENKHYL